MIGVVSGILHIILFPIISCIVIIYVRHKYVSNWYSKEENAFDNRRYIAAVSSTASNLSIISFDIKYINIVIPGS